jgi:hypothetical protein
MKRLKQRKTQKRTKESQRRHVPSHKHVLDPIGERSQQLISKKAERLRNLKKSIVQEKEDKALKECTFRPKINKRSKMKSRNVKDLYNWHKEKRTKIYEKETSALKEVTLTPKINRSRRRSQRPKSNLKVEDRLLSRIKITQEKIKQKQMQEIQGLFTPRRDKTSNYRSVSVIKSVNNWSAVSSPNPINCKSTRYFSKVKLTESREDFKKELKFDEANEIEKTEEIEIDAYEMPKKKSKKRSKRMRKKKKKKRDPLRSISKPKNKSKRSAKKNKEEDKLERLKSQIKCLNDKIGEEFSLDGENPSKLTQNEDEFYLLEKECDKFLTGGSMFQSIINQKENLMPLNRKRQKSFMKRGKRERNREDDQDEIEALLGQIQKKCSIKERKDRSERRKNAMCFSRKSSTSVVRKRRKKRRKEDNRLELTNFV